MTDAYPPTPELDNLSTPKLVELDSLPTPELDKQLAIIKSGKAEIIQDFIDWYLEQGLCLAKFEERSFEEPCPGDGLYWEHNRHGEVRLNTLSKWQTCKRCRGTGEITVQREAHWDDGRSPQTLMADFFSIDEKKIEAERREILEAIRMVNHE